MADGDNHGPVEPKELENLIADRSANRAADAILKNYIVIRRAAPAGTGITKAQAEEATRRAQ